MFRDDLERVVDEIENSETMWLGITKKIHGYDEIDIEDKVTVRSEVARLMRLHERAMRNNILNNPDNYLLANSDAAGTALRARPAGVAPQAPISLPIISPVPTAAVLPPPAGAAPNGAPPAAALAVQANDPDQSPATAPPKPPPENAAKDADKDAPKDATKDNSMDNIEGGNEISSAKEETKPVAASPAPDPDAAPASAPEPGAPKSSGGAPDDGKANNGSKHA